jgi:NAD(P)-dependent dehydrogenase (short-subunit alcohol dehydrogenase family)
MDLAGNVAVVTGPAKGMGPAITRALAQAGADIVMVGRDVAAMRSFAPEIEAMGRRVLIQRGDIADAADMAAMGAAVAEAFDGRLDILVNVAGVRGTLDKTGWEMTPGEFDEVIAANLRGSWLPARAVLPLMVARRRGKIVNIGGTFGMKGRPLRVAYSSSKWALRGLTRSLALEAGPHNINVNCVCPGVVKGPRHERTMAERMALRGVDRATIESELTAEIALRRFVTDADIAAAVMFLVSEGARNITGQELVVDGGFVV